jgi:glycosyltransferase involved in cell wall biosynthesis
MLERCPGLEGAVEERNGLSDAEMRHLLQGASALLLPSFAEGYGMPVPEALALGVPVICSDLPALREAGGNVPDYLDPLDGIRWLDAIEDFARDGPMRTSQMRRVGGWQPWTWDQHMQRVRDAIEASVSE